MTDNINSQEPITALLQALRDGDSQAADGLWSAYYHLMCDLASRKIGRLPNLLVDQEDVALSAFKSFYVGMREDKFPTLKDRQGLWPLLIALTVRKAVDSIRYETRQKRGGGKGENNPCLATLDRTVDVLSLMKDSSRPEMVIELQELLRRLLAHIREI
jgi:hypothetical protein